MAQRQFGLSPTDATGRYGSGGGGRNARRRQRRPKGASLVARKLPHAADCGANRDVWLAGSGRSAWRTCAIARSTRNLYSLRRFAARTESHWSDAWPKRSQKAKFLQGRHKPGPRSQDDTGQALAWLLRSEDDVQNRSPGDESGSAAAPADRFRSYMPARGCWHRRAALEVDPAAEPCARMAAVTAPCRNAKR